MQIYKVINNNVVSVLDEKGQEMILTGKGIGFKKKVGEEVIRTPMTKLFCIQDEQLLKDFKTILKHLSLQHLQISTDIIAYAEEALHTQLSPSIYITLTDHIDFALQRFKVGMRFQNALTHEIKTYYPTEYEIGKYGLNLILNATGISLPQDEAASIAMHLINAEYSIRMQDIYHITELLPELLTFISKRLPFYFEESSPTWDWINNNLKFFLHHLIRNDWQITYKPSFCHCITEDYPDAYSCSVQLAEFIGTRLDYELKQQHIIYLTICIMHLTKGESL